jgi:multidrug resistance protein, MATE family
MSLPVRPVDGSPPLAGSLWAISLPLVFVELGEMIVHVTDTVLLAHVGHAELGAVALGDVVLELAIVPAVGLVEAVQIVVARRAGQGRQLDLRRAFFRGMVLIGIVSVVAAACIAVLAPALAPRLVGNTGVGGPLVSFLRIAAVGIVFETVSLGLGALCVGLGRTRILLWVTAVLVVTNLALDSVLIFGRLGLPALGIEGAALGSVLAEIAAFGVLAVYVLRKLDVRPVGNGATNERLTRSLVDTAWPVSLEAALDTARWLVFFLVVARVGEEALAASSIVYACYAVFVIPAVGFAEAACSLVSHLVGRGETAGIPLVVRRLVRRAGLLTLPLFALGVLAPESLLTIFGTAGGNPEGVATAVRVVALAMLVAVPGELWLAALTGTGDTVLALRAQLAESAVMAGGAGLAVMLGAGVPGAWAAVGFAWLVGLGLAKTQVERGRWRSRFI